MAVSVWLPSIAVVSSFTVLLTKRRSADTIARYPWQHSHCDIPLTVKPQFLGGLDSSGSQRLHFLFV